MATSVELALMSENVYEGGDLACQWAVKQRCGHRHAVGV